MGKATELDEELSVQPLSPTEIAARNAAAESGGQVQATLDGEIIKQVQPSEAPRVVLRAPQQTWD
jgi:hypothetical protein